MGDIIRLVAVCGVFGLSMVCCVVKLWTKHQQQMFRIRMEGGNLGDASVRAAVDALREEVRALRDTSMQYDISFDAAVQRLEQRVGALERAQAERLSSPREIRQGVS